MSFADPYYRGHGLGSGRAQGVFGADGFCL